MRVPLRYAFSVAAFSVLLTPLIAQAALYQPGATLNPSCAPTDNNCGIATSTPVLAGTLGQVPYYASAGSVLTATSSLTILQNGDVGIGTTSPFTLLSVAGNGYFSGSLGVGDIVDTLANLGLSPASTSALSSAMNIYAWGDSITYGNQDNTGVTMPNVLAALSGRSVINEGIGGNTTAQITARFLASASSTVEAPFIIWAGRNDVHGNQSTDEANIDAGIASMVAAATSTGNNNYVILSILTSDASGGYPWEGATSTDGIEISNINTDLSNTYGPSHFLNVLNFLNTQAMSVLGLASTSQDTIDAAAGIPPNSLRSVGVHLNHYGYTAVADYIYQNIGLFGSTPASVVTAGVLQNVFSQNLGVQGQVSATQYDIGGNAFLTGNTSNVSVSVGDPQSALFFNSTTTPIEDIAIGPAAGGGNVSQSLSPSNGGVLVNQFNVSVGQLTLGNAIAFDNDVGIGYEALANATTTIGSTAVGYEAGFNDLSGSFETLVGINAGGGLSNGGANTFVGYRAGQHTTSGASNVALGGNGNGNGTLGSNTTGAFNVAIGAQALWGNVSASTSVAIGALTDSGNGSTFNAAGATEVGYEAGDDATIGSDYNTFMGYQTGLEVTSGNDNILIGPEKNPGGSHLTTGNANVCIGFNCILPGGAGANNQLNIGNLIFGTGLTATSSLTTIPTVLTGYLGIGTSTPYATLEVWGPNSSGTTTAFSVVTSASSTAFAVYDNGNATYSGSIFNSSDQRLKTDVTPLDASTSLQDILGLTPVSYTRIDQPGTGTNLGFIAQAVQQIFPGLVSTTTATALTPGGTLTLNYSGLIAPIVESVQALATEVNSVAATVAGFADSFTSDTVTASQKLCVGGTCITGAQLQQLMQNAGEETASDSAGPIIITDGPAATTTDDTTSTSTDESSSDDSSIQDGTSTATSTSD